MKKTAPSIIPIAAIVMGIALLAFFAMSSRQASRSDHWPQTAATITTGGSPGGEVQYRYTAGGTEHTGKSTDHLGYYTKGRTLVVYVNPDNAADSRLELGRRPPQWIWVSGTFALVVGFVLLLLRSRGAGAGRGKRKGPARKTQNRRPMQRLKPPAGIERKPE